MDGARAIAVVGIGLRLPGGVRDLEGLRRLLRAGADAIRPVPRDRWDPDAWGTPAEGGFLDDLQTFDAAFFGITPREARALDPAQRLLLEVAWEALEHAGLAPDRQAGSGAGVYVGLGSSDYARRHLLGPDPARIDGPSATGGLLSMAAGRIAYTFGTRGPALTVDTACSSSLVAVHLAVEALRRGEVDRALAGGANVLCAPQPSVAFQRIGALSPDGRCRTFDAAAAGYGRGEGAGLVVLERLEVARAAGRRILAVIEGTALNQDGRTTGLTAPSGAAQQALIRAALADAGREPAEVDYVEAHGTATPLGDAIELDALRAVFVPRDRPLFVGSAKANLGHLETAAGVAGLARALLVLGDGEVHPHPHLREPTSRVRWDGLEVAREPKALPARVVGVSSFGLSGTNAHVVLGAPEPDPRPVERRPVEVLLLSGRTPEHVRALAERWRPEMAGAGAAEVAEAGARRAVHPWRAAVVGSDGVALAAGLAAVAPARAERRPRVAFVASDPGGGAGAALAEAEPLFRAALAEVSAESGAGAVAVALALTWARLGAEPDLVVGEGEVAARVARAFPSAERGGSAEGAVPLALGATGGVGPFTGGDEATGFARALAELWCAGVAVDPRRGRSPGPFAELSPTVFLGERHWLPSGDERPEPRVWRPAWRAEEAPGGALPRIVEAADGDPEALLAAGVDAVRAAVADGAELAFVLREGAVDAAVLAGLAAVARREHPEIGAAVAWWDGADRAALEAALRGARGELRVVGGRREVAVEAPAEREGPPFPLSPASGEREGVRGHGGRIPPGTVLLTGGTGAIGRRIVAWLRARGATRVLVVGRGTVPALDLRDEVATRELVDGLDDLVGVVHAAGAIDDAPLLDHDPARIAAVLGARVRGARALDRATRGRGLGLFVLVSSASGRLGTPGQAAYAGAARWLEALAEDRRAAGEAATCVSFGPWTVGLGDAPPEVVARWRRDGVGRLRPDEAIEALDRALAGPPVVVVVQPAADPSGSDRLRVGDGSPARPPSDPPRQAGHFLPLVREALADVLGWPPDRRPGLRDGFFELGLDSVGALELRDRLRRATGLPLGPTVALDHPDLERLAAHLASLGTPPPEIGPALRREASGPVDVVGVACRLPGGIEDPDAFWAAIVEGRDLCGEVPPDRFDAARWVDPDPRAVGRLRTGRGGFVEGLADVDHALFGLSPAEAATLDPQHRLLLEGAWRALEDARIPPLSLRGSRTGVYVGVQASEYGLRFDPTDPAVPVAAATGSAPCFAAGRVAHALGLRGPAVGVDTACSSSLVALADAVRDLRQGACDLAIVAGVNAITGPRTSLWMTLLGALSPTGRCHAFDASADGYVRSEGCVVLVLRRADAGSRRVLGRVLGAAIGHDGASAGLTVPSGPAQEEVIRGALADAGVAPSDVGYVECHGTGTPLGDPIELRALGAVLGDRPGPLWLGAAKAVTGHLEAGAGLVGVLQALLVLRRGVVPPVAGLREPNPALPLGAFPALRLPTAPTPWTADRRIAGVSSFGISGTNAHVVLEGVAAPAEAPAVHAERARVVAVSGHSPEHLRRVASALAAAELEPADLERGSFLDRSPLRRRGFAVGTDRAELAGALLRIEGVEALDDPGVVFLCTGAGPQAPGMGRGLYEREPAWRAAFDEACRAADPLLGRPLASVVFGDDPATLDDLRWTQPAQFAVCWASAALWASLGVRPAALIGHSTGQLVAACLAGVLDLPDAMALTVRRARLMSELPRDGEMVAVLASEAEVAPHLGPDVSLAAVNGPSEVVLSGRRAAVRAAAEALRAAGREVRPLAISHAAHSACVDPVLEPLGALVAGLRLRPPSIPLVENVRGELADAAVTTPSYWREHLRRTVRFEAGVRTLLGLGHRVFVELGNHPVLAGMVGRIAPEVVLVPTLRRDVDDDRQLAGAVGALWSAGVALDLPAFLRDRGGRPADLPKTPFLRRRAWVPSADEAPAPPAAWEERWAPVRPGVGALGGRGPEPLLVVGDPGGLGGALVARQRRRAEIVPLDADLDEAVARIRPARLVVVADGTTPRATFVPALRAVRAALRAGAPPTFLVTRGACAAGGPADPLGAGVLGLGAVGAVEAPELPLVRVDLDPGASEADALLHLELVLDADLDEEQLAVRGGRHLVRRLARAGLPPAGPWPEAAGTTLLTGGRGALGRAIAARIRGPVVLVGRTPPEDPDPTWITADLGLPGAVEAVLDEVRRRGLPPVAAVVHAAGVLEDAALGDVDPAAVDRVWAGKVDGALALDRALPDARPFVLLSSAAATVGSAGQAVYAGANAVLDALASARRGRGAHALSVALGPVGGPGLAAGTSRDWAAEGVRPLSPAAAVDAVASALRADRTAVTVLDVDWGAWAARQARVPALVRDLVAPRAPAPPKDPRATVLEELGAVLGRDPAGLPADRGLSELGLDSLGAVDLARRLRRRLGIALPATVAFDHPTVDALVAHLRGEAAPTPSAAEASGEVPLAIVGMALRMPGGANDPEAFWELLRSGRDPLGPVPAWRWDHDALGLPAEAGFVDDAVVQGFDAPFFGLSPREAEALDPQQRMLLEVAQEAFERAGMPTAALRGRRGAVMVGIGDSGYLQRFQRAGAPLHADAHEGTGNLSAFASGRLAHVFGLLGPNLALNTACSSSLVAIHLACRALRDGEADLALAGGVHLMLSPEHFTTVGALRALSPGARCRTFDADADGYARAEGCALFVLQRLDVALAEGRRVLAVVRGTAVGHDGASAGLTVPSRAAQAAVIRAALDRSGLAPDAISAIEAHGTGTALGDPIEVGALRDVFGPRPPEAPLRLGAVKANVGHLEVAAGAASVAKMVLALRHRELPPQLHFRAPNPELELEASGYAVATRPTPWTAPGPLRCGISSFGIAGTDAHVVLEEPPAPAVPPTEDPGPHLLLLSARSAAALPEAAADVARLLDAATPGDVAAALATRRSAWEHRRAVVGRTRAELVERLRAVDGGATRRAGKVAFLFAGQGAQAAGMGLSLGVWPAFREVLDRAEEVLAPLLPGSLRAALGSEAVHDPLWIQPCLYVLEVGLARLWESFGVRPDLVLGHSVGSLAAATVAGVLSLDDGLRLVAARARLLASLPPGGGMAAVAASEEVVLAALAGREVALAAVNHPEECTISGPVPALEAVCADLAARGVKVTRLQVGQALHSPLVEPVLDAFETEVRRVELWPPRIGVVSDLDGRLATEADLRDPRQWRRRVREPVRFAAGLRTLGELGADLLIEIGPHTTLTGMARATLPGARGVPSLVRGGEDPERLLAALGEVWELGLRLDWSAVDRGRPRAWVDLPTTRFQRRRTWLDRPEFPDRRPAAERWCLAEVWVPAPPPPSTVELAVEGEGPLLQLLAGPPGPRRVLVVDLPEDPEVDPVPACLRVLEALREPGPLVVVTRGATDGSRPAAGAVHGLVRAAAAEDPSRRLFLVDVVGEPDPEALLAAVRADDEPEVRVADGIRLARRLRRTSVTGPAPAPAVVVVTGGLSGLGLAVARSLRDARGLVLVGRRAPTPEVAAWIERSPVPIRVVRGDLSDELTADRAVAEARELAPGAPLAVVHAAGALADKALGRVTEADLRATLEPKLVGAVRLHRALVGEDVAWCVLFSAGAGWLGAPGQAAYAAANAGLDALARWMRGRGVPAVAVAWGAFEEVGMAARLDPAHAARRRELGLGTIPLAGGLELLLRARTSPEPLLGVLPTEWAVYAAHRPLPLLSELAPPPTARASEPAWAEAAARLPADRRAERVRAEVGAAVARVLKLASPPLPATPLTELGLDSLLAIELKNALADGGVDLPIARLVGGPSLDQLVIAVGEALPDAAVPPIAAEPPPVHPVVSHGLAFAAGVAFVVVGYLAALLLAR